MDLTGLVGAATLIVGLLTGIVQLIDWVLPKSAVDRISHLLTHVWVWLADQQAGRLLKWLADSRPIKWIVVTVLVVVFMFTFPALIPSNDRMMPMIEIVVVVLCVLPGIASSAAVLLFASYFRLSQLADWITAKPAALPVLWRVACICIGGAVPVASAYLFFDEITRNMDDFAFVVSIAILSFFLLPVLLSSFVLALILAWLLVVGASAIALRVAEFFVRRVIEHPKGPVLAVVALLTAIGGILRSVS